MQYRELKLKEDLARRESEMINVLQSEQAVNSAKKDFTQLRNVDRPLYDLLLTKGSAGFNKARTDRVGKEKYAPSNALPVMDDYLIGDIPQLIGNQEESSFLTQD